MGAGVTASVSNGLVAYSDRGDGADGADGEAVGWVSVEPRTPGEPVPWGEAHVGTRAMFEDAGFVEVGRPTLRRVVMRVGF